MVGGESCPQSPNFLSSLVHIKHFFGGGGVYFLLNARESSYIWGEGQRVEWLGKDLGESKTCNEDFLFAVP